MIWNLIGINYQKNGKGLCTRLHENYAPILTDFLNHNLGLMEEKEAITYSLNKHLLKAPYVPGPVIGLRKMRHWMKNTI